MRKITALAALTMAGLALAVPAAQADNNMGGKLSTDHPVGAAGTCVEQLGSIPLVGKQASAATPVCGAYAVVPRG